MRSKGTTTGGFYVPNATCLLSLGYNVTSIPTLRVEMLFSNANIAGDQTSGNGNSPYPDIANYPDGIVDISDVAAVSASYSSKEGKP
jgi:hypothetical protein